MRSSRLTRKVAIWSRWTISSGANVDAVTDPFTVNDVTMSSVTSPIRVGGATVGVAGIDVPLTSIQEQIAGITPYSVGHAALITSSGVVLASNRPGDEAGAAIEGEVGEAVRPYRWGRPTATGGFSTGAPEPSRRP